MPPYSLDISLKVPLYFYLRAVVPRFVSTCGPLCPALFLPAGRCARRFIGG